MRARHLVETRSFSVNRWIQSWTIQAGPHALGNNVQQSRSTVRLAMTLFSWHIKEYITRKYTLKSNCLCIYLLSTRLAAIVIHGSHLSDNALIHSTNKHIPPGYLRVCVATLPLAKQEAGNSRWCWLINWQVNFQMDNESRTLKDGREKSRALCSTWMQCHLSITGRTTARSRYTGPGQVFVLSGKSWLPFYITSVIIPLQKHIKHMITGHSLSAQAFCKLTKISVF